MRAAISLSLLLAACSQQPAAPPENNLEGAEVEALPADESVTTPSDELAIGAAEPQGNTAELEGNAGVPAANTTEPQP